MLATLAIWTVYASTFILKGLPQPDEGYVFQHALELVRGKVVYRDTAPHVPPLSLWIQGAWIRVFGEALWVSRLHCFVEGALTILLVQAALGAHFRPGWAFLLTLPAITVCTALIGPFAWYNSDATLFFLVGAVALVRQVSSAEIIAGLAFGASFLAKTNFGAIGGFIGLLVCLRRGRRSSATYFAALVTLPLLFLTWLFLFSDPQTFFKLVVAGQFGEKGRFGMFARLLTPVFTLLSLWSLPLQGALWAVLAGRPAVAALGVVLLGVVGASVPADVSVVTFAYTTQVYMFGALAALMWADPRARLHGALGELTAFGIGLLITDSLSQDAVWVQNACAFLSVPLLFGLILELHERGVLVVRRVMLGALLVVLFVAGFKGKLEHPFREDAIAKLTQGFSLPALRYITVRPDRAAAMERVLTRVVRDTADLGRGGMLVWPEGSTFYVATGKDCPTRLMNIASTFQQKIVDDFEADELARLQQAPPRFCLFVNTVTTEPAAMRPDSVMSVNRFKRIGAWITASYETVDDTGYITLLRLRGGR